VLIKLFTEHPRSVGETYGEHLASAMRFASLLQLGALVCCVHALAPFLFTRTGSRIVGRLHEIMVRNRRRKPQADGDALAAFDYVI